LAGSSC
jgi:hypothetical protein